MIARGSMVALKGHHRVPMVVAKLHAMVTIKMNWSGEALRAARMEVFRRAMEKEPPADEDVPAEDAEEHVEVVWLDAHGKPQRQVYPISLLEEIDG